MRTLKKSSLISVVLGISLSCCILLLIGFKTIDTESLKQTTHVVVIHGMKFHPEEIVIKKGDIVEWINKDIVPHDITEHNKNWTSGSMKTGEKWSKKFTESSAYFCSIHVVMKGNVIVSD